MRNGFKAWNAKLFVYIGLLFICCSVTMPIAGCDDWEAWAKKNPEKAREIANQIRNSPDAFVPVPADSSSLAAVDNAEAIVNAAKPLADAASPVTGGISALLALIVTQSISGIRLLVTEIESRRLRKAILALHNSPVANEKGVAGLVTDPAAKLTLAKVSGDLHPL